MTSSLSPTEVTTPSRMTKSEPLPLAGFTIDLKLVYPAP